MTRQGPGTIRSVKHEGPTLPGVTRVDEVQKDGRGQASNRTLELLAALGQAGVTALGSAGFRACRIADFQVGWLGQDFHPSAPIRDIRG